MKEIFELHAEICKTLANPKRLEIINELRQVEKTASDLVDELGISKANLSQHMNILTEKGVVIAERRGVRVYYRLFDDRIIAACGLMRQVLLRKLEENRTLLEKAKLSEHV